MELRVLNYFLTVAREESITGAANALHLSQPTLSRQLKDLEDELGVQLFVRGNRKIELTEEGRILKSRAEEIIGLVQKAEEEVAVTDSEIEGSVYICAGESESVRYLVRAMKRVNTNYPKIKFHIESGDNEDVNESLLNGKADFAIGFFAPDETQFDYVNVPATDRWGVLMRKDAPLAEKDMISVDDLIGQPLIMSRSYLKHGIPPVVNDLLINDEDVIGTYSLLYNASLMAEEGLGYVLCLDGIFHTEGTNLCFRPTSFGIPVSVCIMWKKERYFSKAAKKLLNEILKINEEGTIE